MSKRNSLPKCLNCGKCCIVWNPTTDLWEDCKHLIHYADKTTKCSIYNKRLGAVVGFMTLCHRRKDTTYNIPDCPFNKEGQETHRFYKYYNNYK